MRFFIIQLVVLGCLLTILEAYKPGLVGNRRKKRDANQQMPWVADLVDESKGVYTFCGGTLVGHNRRWVVTSGQCMANRNSAYIKSKMLVTSETLAVSKVVIHPNLHFFDFDIAMVKLKKSPKTKSQYLPFWNPTIGDFREDVCYIGFVVEPVTFVDTTTCQINLDVEYCAAVSAGYADFILNGDALWCIRNGQKYMAGLVSNELTPDDNNPQADHIFGLTPMSSYIAWLYQVRMYN